MSRFGTALLVACVALSLGCNLRSTKEKPGKPTELHSALLGGGDRGLAAEGNDAKIVALANAALACAPEPNDDASLFDPKCPAFKAWREDPAIAKQGASFDVNVTLVNMLEDPNERVRFLGARALGDATAYRTDRALATRVIAAAAAEKFKALFDPLGDRVARIDVAKTGLLAPISEIIKKPDEPGANDKKRDMKLAIIGSLLFENSNHRPTYDLFVSLTRDPDTRIRSKAVSAFWIGGNLSKPETCKVFESHLEDSDDTIAAHSTMLLGWYHSCSSSYDVLLGSLETRLKSGRIDKSSDSDYASAPGRMCEDKDANPAQKQRGAAVARTLASNTDLRDSMRSSAIRSVVSCDPKNGRAFVSRFGADKSSWVRDAVKDAMKAKK